MQKLEERIALKYLSTLVMVPQGPVRTGSSSQNQLKKLEALSDLGDEQAKLDLIREKVRRREKVLPRDWIFLLGAFPSISQSERIYFWPVLSENLSKYILTAARSDFFHPPGSYFREGENRGVEREIILNPTGSHEFSILIRIGKELVFISLFSRSFPEKLLWTPLSIKSVRELNHWLTRAFYIIDRHIQRSLLR